MAEQKEMTVSNLTSDRAQHLSCTTMLTPVGDLVLVADESSLRAVVWPGDDAARVAGATDLVLGEVAASDHPVLSRVVEQLTEYFDGERMEFDLPLDPAGTPFQLAAWQVLRTIPYGSTMTYGEQAVRLGDRGKARAVGAANGRNPLSIVVPCHRVIGSNGHLTGFGGGLGSKAWLLDHEQRVLIAS
jgi:methylated-DNA-[protein]-cysteine S-methyltransferase